MARPHPALVALAAGRRPPGIRTVDDGLLASAVDHGMHGLLWTWVRDHEPGYSERARLAGLDAATRQRHGRLWETLYAVRRALRAIDVEIATVKGVAAEARWYDRVGERPCTDLDVLVDPAAVHRAGEIVAVLEPAHPLRSEIGGLVRRSIMQSVNVHVGGMPVDLHFDLLKLGFPMRGRQLVWDRTLRWTTPDGSTVRVPDAEISLVHFLVHANKDSFSRLLAYADVARLLATGHLDWAFIERFLNAEGLGEIVGSSLETVVRALQLPATPLAGERRGVRARLWRAVWPEPVTLLGSAGVHRSRRQDVLPFLVRGRLLEALRHAGHLVFPPPAAVARQYPDLDGGYLWRLTKGRIRTWRGRRAALRARRAPVARVTPPHDDPLLTARLLRARAQIQPPLWLEVSGPSMGWSIRSGARVRVEPARSPRPGEVWAFCDDRGTIVVHRSRGRTEGAYRFQGDTQVRADPPVSDAQLIGRVVEVAPGRARLRWGRLAGALQRTPRVALARTLRTARRVRRGVAR